MARTFFGSAPYLGHLPSPPFTCKPAKSSRFATLRVSASTNTPASFSANCHPSLEVVSGALDSFLPAFKNLNLPYVPYPLIGWNRHVETIFAAFLRSLPDVRFRRECLRTRDDGAVALDWVCGDDRNLPSDSPVLILLTPEWWERCSCAGILARWPRTRAFRVRCTYKREQHKPNGREGRRLKKGQRRRERGRQK